MIPIPTSRVFRTRRGALVWSFWVIVAAVLAAGLGDRDADRTQSATPSVDALGTPIDDQDVRDLTKAINAN